MFLCDCRLPSCAPQQWPSHTSTNQVTAGPGDNSSPFLSNVACRDRGIVLNREFSAEHARELGCAGPTNGGPPLRPHRGYHAPAPLWPRVTLGVATRPTPRASSVATVRTRNDSTSGRLHTLRSSSSTLSGCGVLRGRWKIGQHRKSCRSSGGESLCWRGMRVVCQVAVCCQQARSSGRCSTGLIMLRWGSSGAKESLSITVGGS